MQSNQLKEGRNGGHITLKKVNLVIEMAQKHPPFLSFVVSWRCSDVVSTVRYVSCVEAMFHGPIEAEKDIVGSH